MGWVRGATQRSTTGFPLIAAPQSGKRLLREYNPVFALVKSVKLLQETI